MCGHRAGCSVEYVSFCKGQARIQLLAKGEVVKIMENNNFAAASSKCQRPHATKTISATNEG